MANSRNAPFIPALSYDWLTRSYDPLLRWTMPEMKFKCRLIEQSGLSRGQRVLDVGCGTATLTILAKQACPDAEVVGLDGDSNILALARAKAARTKTDLTLDHGMAFNLPYADCSFDRVLSSLVIHHLASEDKRRTFKEMHRVLRPGGELHMADWGPPGNPLMAILAAPLRWFEQAEDNIRGRLPDMMSAAGLVNVEETSRFATLFGTLCLYQASKEAAK